MTTPPLPEQIELHRDRMWRRDEDLRIESAVAAERFIEDGGLAGLTPRFPGFLPDADERTIRAGEASGRDAVGNGATFGVPPLGGAL